MCSRLILLLFFPRRRLMVTIIRRVKLFEKKRKETDVKVVGERRKDYFT